MISTDVRGLSSWLYTENNIEIAENLRHNVACSEILDFTGRQVVAILTSILDSPDRPGTAACAPIDFW